MKKPTKGLSTKKAVMAGAAVVSLSAGMGMSANAASGTGAMSAVILTPIVVADVLELNFGSITVRAAGAGGAVIVDPAGARTISGGTTVGDVFAVTGAGNEKAGTISLTAATGVSIDLSVAAGPTANDATLGGEAITDGYLIATGGATNTNQRMLVGDFIIGAPTTGIGGGATAGSGTSNAITGLRLNRAGTPTAVFPLGGTLLVKATNVAGTYTGAYDLVAAYQ